MTTTSQVGVLAPQSLAEALRIARNRKGATLRQVESALGISQIGLCRLETGYLSNPTERVLAELAGFYGVPVEQFLRWM